MMQQNIEKVDIKKNEVDEKLKIFQLITSNISNNDVNSDLSIFQKQNTSFFDKFVIAKDSSWKSIFDLIMLVAAVQSCFS